MKLKWTPISAFVLAMLLGVGYVLASAWWSRHQSRPTIEFKELTRGVWLTSQITLDDISKGRLHGVKTLVDLRPDGEATDQPPAAAIQDAIKNSGMKFSYIPVPHGTIPNDAVLQLQKLLREQPNPILLYCRSGNRAARTWALSEASTDFGLSGSTIRSSVSAAGFSTSDIDAEIDSRIGARKHDRK